MPEILKNSLQQNVKISNRARVMQASPLRKLAATAEVRKKQGVKVYHLNIGQPDLPTATIVYETIYKLGKPTLAYAPSAGINQTITAWKNYFKHVGIDFDESEIIVTSGGSEAIIFAMCAICDAEDEIIVFEPFYTNYNGFATIANVKLHPVPLSISNGFHLPDISEIEKHINKRTKGILFTNPSNPTGTVYTKDELRRLVIIAQKHNLYLLADEVYREFNYDSEFYSIMNFDEVRNQTILLDSCSKRFNVCGARIGALASHNKDIINSAFKFAMARLSVATIEQLAIIPLLNNPDEYINPIVEEFRKRRDAVYEYLKTIPNITYYKPEGAFYIVIGLPVKDSEDFCKWLIEDFEHNKETVLIAPAQGFYATPDKGINEVRLAFTIKIEELIRALEIIKLALEKYKNR